MIKNPIIALSKQSKVREEARNIIQYTMLFKPYYNVPAYSTSDEVVFDVLKSCKECCDYLFWNEPCYLKFFGNASLSGKQNSLQTLLWKIGINTDTLTKASLFEPTMLSFILQHCVISCYHAVRTAQNNGELTTLYKVANSSEKGSSSAKSSSASSMMRKTVTHLQHLSNFNELITTVDSSSGSTYRIDRLFSTTWNSVCHVDASYYKRLYTPKSANDNYTNEKATKLLTDTVELYASFTKSHLRDGELTTINPVESLYRIYLIERIFNLRLFYTIYKEIEYVNKKTDWRLDLPSFIPVFSLLQYLPNVFSRQAMLAHAISFINNGTDSHTDFWSNFESGEQDVIMRDSRTIIYGFSLDNWITQLKLFTNYLSQLVIPTFEWCFTDMLFQSIEDKYPEEDYDFHLGKAKEVLEIFIGKHYQSLIRPLDFSALKSNTHNKANLPEANEIDIVTPIGSVVSSYDVSNRFLDNLYRSYFDVSRNINLNLSPTISISYFNARLKNPHTSITSHIRQTLIDVFRYEYWDQDTHWAEKKHEEKKKWFLNF